MSLKSDIEEVQKESESKKLERELKTAFKKVMNNPTEKEIKYYKEVEYALLSVWASNLFNDTYKTTHDAIDYGRVTAKDQLKAKGFKKITEIDVYSDLKRDNKRELKNQIDKLIATIQGNSDRAILEIRNSFIMQKKKMTVGFVDSFNKYGVTYFTDRAGRNWTLERYTDMLTTTKIASAERSAFFASSLEYGNDLVKVIHLGLTPECPYCRPFNGTVLSITGQTKGYLSVDQATAMSGHLFSFNCDHSLKTLQLAPDKVEGDETLTPTKELEKRAEKKGFKTELNKFSPDKKD